jgi:hypothetical protein
MVAHQLASAYQYFLTIRQGLLRSKGPMGSKLVCAVNREGVGLQWVQFPPGNWVT